VQALQLNELGIIPDKIILLTATEDAQQMKMKENLLVNDPNMEMDDLKVTVKNQITEYKLNIKGIKETFGNFLFEVTESDGDLIYANLVSMLRVKYNKESPRKSPCIIVQGPPGSGRTTQAKFLAK
jgi:hypothetical protein